MRHNYNDTASECGERWAIGLKTYKRLKETLLLLSGLGAVCFFYGISGIGCPVKWITGISCAGCGMTRAVFYAVQLQFGKAFYYHPLFWMLPFGALLFIFWEKIPVKIQKCVIWTVIACFAGTYVIRLIYSDHCVVAFDVKNGLIARLWRYILAIQ